LGTDQKHGVNSRSAVAYACENRFISNDIGKDPSDGNYRSGPILALFKEQLEAECATLATKHDLKKRGDFFLIYWYFIRLKGFTDNAEAHGAKPAN
jgi:hypothetical protein